MKYTEEELLAALEDLAEKWPKSHWIFVGEGGINLMRCGEDGSRVMTQWAGGDAGGASVDGAYFVGSVNIPSDGGGW